MELIQLLPTNQYCFWLPVYHGDEAATRAVKRIVLRAFRHKVVHLKAQGNVVRVRDFRWVEHHDFIDCEVCEPFLHTFGWKATIQSWEISND